MRTLITCGYGFACGLQYTATGKACSYMAYCNSDKQLSYCRNAELIGMFSLTVAEIGLTFWAGNAYFRDGTKNILSWEMQTLGGAGVLYLAWKALAAISRTTSELYVHFRIKRLLRRALKEPRHLEI